jgi:hypothetical protein
MLAHARQIEAVPRQRLRGPVGAEEDLFAEEGPDQFAQLGALQLDERYRLWGDAEALQDGEGRHQGFGGRG